MDKYRVLLVDDNNENLKSTKELLHRWGYQVDCASGGEEALELVQATSQEYAVAVLDYCMPEMTGTELAKKLYTQSPETVVLIYSAFPSVESLRATIRVGALNFIDKNEDLQELKAALAKACEEYEKICNQKNHTPTSRSGVNDLSA